MTKGANSDSKAPFRNGLQLRLCARDRHADREY
ncbi:MAG: hypothetical protein QOD30_670 [Actinomycetota bacterium]|jgi:hypothetical protein|nr:hypothetical protein [Actinomycetota bacterium]